MTARPCGGCEGRGSHWRWCPAVHGAYANRLAMWAAQLDTIADSVGSNMPGVANRLWLAGWELETEARKQSALHQKRKEGGS